MSNAANNANNGENKMNYNFLGMFAGNTRNFTGWAADVAAQKLQVALWRNGRAILK